MEVEVFKMNKQGSLMPSLWLTAVRAGAKAEDGAFFGTPKLEGVKDQWWTEVYPNGGVVVGDLVSRRVTLIVPRKGA